MRLVPVDPENAEHVEFLWQLLCLRPADTRVSDDGRTTRLSHTDFVKRHPYWDWCLIETDLRHPVYAWWRIRTEFVGAAFISKPAMPSVVGDELHVEVLPKYQGLGLAAEALLAMMEKHPRSRYVANVAVTNYASMALFKKLGFRLCQFTFELPTDHTKIGWGAKR